MRIDLNAGMPILQKNTAELKQPVFQGSP